MKDTGKKKVYENDKTWVFNDVKGELKAAYIPNNPFDVPMLMEKLSQVPFTRVVYISRYNGRNTTPRLTWAYGQIDSSVPNPEFTGSADQLMTTLRTIPDPKVHPARDIVSFRNLDFRSEVMPDWLESLAQFCRMTAIMNWGFDPQYDSVILGKYEGPEDGISRHEDTETFLAHHFCANVTIGEPRDFQFFTENADGSSQTHEIKLANTSLFFFLGLPHALPKRAGANGVRYSISFRNMATNVGIGNSFYYCRGLAGAVDNERKREYIEKLNSL